MDRGATSLNTSLKACCLSWVLYLTILHRFNIRAWACCRVWIFIPLAWWHLPLFPGCSGCFVGSSCYRSPALCPQTSGPWTPAPLAGCRTCLRRSRALGWHSCWWRLWQRWQHGSCAIFYPSWWVGEWAEHFIRHNYRKNTGDLFIAIRMYIKGTQTTQNV